MSKISDLNTLIVDEQIAVKDVRKQAFMKGIHSFYLLQAISTSGDETEKLDYKQTCCVFADLDDGLLDNLGYNTSVTLHKYDGLRWSFETKYTCYPENICTKLCMLTEEAFAKYLSTLDHNLAELVKQSRINGFRLMKKQ